MMHPLIGPDNDGSTPLFSASGAPPVCIRSTMAPSSSESDKTSLSPFLLSKGACEAGKHEKNGDTKVHQMMPRASNDALGRIDTKVYLILLVLWQNGFGFGACTSIDPKLYRSIRGWPSGPQKKKTEHEAQHIPPVGAHFRIRIDQGHPMCPILDSTRFITDQIGKNARTGRLCF